MFRLLIFSACIFGVAQGAGAQEFQPKSHGFYIPHEGNIVRAIPAGRQIAIEDSLYRDKINEELKSYEGSGEFAILELGAKTTLLSSAELTENQKSELKNVLVEFRKELESVPAYDTFGIAEVKMKFATPIQDILLPEQLKTISVNIKRPMRVLTILIESEEAQFGLEENEKKGLIKRSAEINSKLAEILKEAEEKAAKVREEIKTAYSEVLNQEQKYRVEKVLDVDSIIENMTIKDMLLDTKAKKKR